MKLFKTILILIISAVIVTILLKLFVIQLYTIESDSMYKTINSNDKVIISKIFTIKTNDIVIYKGKDDQIFLSRSVAFDGDSVITCGQNVYVNRQKVNNKRQVLSYCMRFINETTADSISNIYNIKEFGNSGIFEIRLTDEEYDGLMNDSVTELKSNLFDYEFLFSGTYTLKPSDVNYSIGVDSVFLLNDNRGNIYDSRSLGPISKNDIIGKVIKIF